MSTTFVPTARLRAAFAAEMSRMYSAEVPAYQRLLDVCAEVNAAVLERDPVAAQRLGAAERVAAERHGAIRVGTPGELAQVSRIFAGFGMYPVGFYDLREAARSAIPVISTAFRPIGPDELAANPFRMFTSLLVSDDRRFFAPELRERVDAFLARRRLFAPELLDLARRSVLDAGLPAEQARRFVALATGSFALSSEPVDRAWYAELAEVSSVAADIGGTEGTHINHLTPRVLDIDELYRRMGAQGITMIDTIQGPPRWDGPPVLLRQTSFRALAEPRRFREADGSESAGSIRVRFGEVEARGAALTPAGRDRYDKIITAVDQRRAEAGPEAAAALFAESFPDSETELLRHDLAYFTFQVTGSGQAPVPDLDPVELVERGVLAATPIVYEDFLPRSAAGIFQSNLAGEGTRDDTAHGAGRDAGWLADVIGAEVADPFAGYAEQQRASLRAAAEEIRTSIERNTRS